MSEKLGDGLNERARERMGERFGEIVCKRLYEMLDPNIIQVNFRHSSKRIQKSLNFSQLLIPDDGLTV